MIHVIRASANKADDAFVWGRLTQIAYRGLSRGFGEFMHLTAGMVDAAASWVCYLPEDIEMPYHELPRACSTCPGDWFALALTPDSHTSHGWMKSNHAGWKEVPFVDLAPVYRRPFHDWMRPHFAESKSGWGLDVLFGDRHRQVHGVGAWLYGDARQRHGKKLESQNWVIDGLTPMDELQRIRRTYSL